MKVITTCNAPKAQNAVSMEALIQCQLEDGTRKSHLLVSSCLEDVSRHLIDKKRKNVLSWPFALRRSSSDPLEAKPTLFKQPLAIICGEDTLPKPILDVLTLLCLKGTTTEGIFRKPANQKALKELKDDLNLGKAVDLQSKSVHLLAAILKEFLREIPHKLLSCDLCHEWMAALEKMNIHDRIEDMKQVADKLPGPNLLLLRYLVCVLHHISKNSDVNKMDSSNLAVCIGPNLLTLDQDTSLSLEAQKELSDKVNALVAFFIENCFELFGEDVSALLSGTSEDSFEQLDSAELSSVQHSGSAYVSTDPEAKSSSISFPDWQLQPEMPWGCDKCGSEKTRGHFDKDSDPSNPSRTNKCKVKINRRCSEPNFFPQPSQVSLRKEVKSKKLTRSHDDISVWQKSIPFENQEPAKRLSGDYFPTCLYKKKKPLSLMVNTKLQPQLSSESLGKTSSSCSLDSNSDSSVFTNSPRISPSSPKKMVFPRHQSFCIRKAKDANEAHPIKELKKHSMSFSFVSKKVLTKTQSWEPERSNSFRRERSKKELRKESQLVCKTVQEKSTNEPQPTMPRKVLSRIMSADEVFRLVDQKNPGKPPSYEEAIHRNLPAQTPSYQNMTVQRMRDTLTHEDRFLPHSQATNHTYRTDVSSTQNSFPLDVESPTNGTVQTNLQVHGRPTVYRTRTMSESLQKYKHEYLSRRCSQPLFNVCDQIQYTKESYV
ncbi:T-cell activation Rho GTPase-activating protein isoform X2 [Microcaecilia unicolor]|nr:T-cell activation Rho GTPase-activating protein isoform X2 [Microcaecilia unicolor]XP_030054291.1 T-cell activation Rho GTPase-activating protein isoform X2 [Microcaecilia unicolor]